MQSQRLRSAAASGEWDSIDLSKITKEMVGEKDQSRKRNILHIATAEKKLDKVPKSLWHHDLFLKTDDQANTILHLAAEGDQFHLIPKELNRRKILSRINKENYIEI